MKILAQNIFEEFEKKILDPHYHPSTPLATLQSQLTAASMLRHQNNNIARQAKAFIKKTSVFRSKNPPPKNTYNRFSGKKRILRT